MTESVISMFRRTAGWLRGIELPVRPLPADFSATLVDAVNARVEERPDEVVIELEIGAPKPEEVGVYWARGVIVVELRCGGAYRAARFELDGAFDGAAATARLGFGILTVRVPRPLVSVAAKGARVAPSPPGGCVPVAA